MPQPPEPERINATVAPLVSLPSSMRFAGFASARFCCAGVVAAVNRHATAPSTKDRTTSGCGTDHDESSSEATPNCALAAREIIVVARPVRAPAI